MNFRKILVSIGCFAAAIGIGSGKPARAGDFQSDNDPVSSPVEPCAVRSARNGQFEGCERIGGHVRIDMVPRIQDTSGFSGPKASPVAVRMDDGTGPRGHLHLPSGLDELDPIRR
jgi:hypothetical protein